MYDLGQLKRMVETSSHLTSDARELSERDRDYYDGYQWTAQEQQVLRNRKQPVITINRIKRKIDAMVGIEQRGRVDPRAFPRNPGDEQAADLATKALVFVEEAERIDAKRSMVFENVCIEGYGGVEICAEPGRDGLDVKVKRLRWEEIIFDPMSREKDFSDAAFIGCMKWMSLDAAVAFSRRFWQGTPEELADILDANSHNTDAGETYEDRPRGEGHYMWIDRKQRRVRVAQVYYKVDDTWHLSIFTGKGVLYNEPSPYLDEFGRPACAILLMSGYVDRENRRYGVVRDMISAQDEINKRRSKLLHQLNSRQTMGVKGAVDVAKMKRELAQPDGHVEWDSAFQEGNIQPFQIVPQSDQVAGQFSLLQEAKSEIDMLGPNASLLGEAGASQSGRAIMAQQQAGLAELQPIYDSLADFTIRMYRQIWAAIKQFWTEPRWIRVTDEMEAPRFIGVNQVAMGPMGPQMVNPIGQIDVDIIIDQAPEYSTLRAEQFEKLAELAQSGMVPIPPAAIIEASDLRDKRKIIEAIEAASQVPPEQLELQARGAQAEVAVMETQAQKNIASAMKDAASVPKLRADAMRAASQAMQPPMEPRRLG